MSPRSELDLNAVVDRIGHIKKREYIAAYSENGNIRLSCELTQVARSTYFKWMQDDPEFAEAIMVAKDCAIERLEQEARRRAVEGVEKPVYQQGQQVGTIREYSDTLLIFLLKGLRPEMYRDRATVDVNARVRHEDGRSNLDREIEGLLTRMDELERVGESPPPLAPPDSHAP